VTAHGVGDGELRRRYAQVFDDVADEYDRERRGYPDELIDAACRVGALSAGDRVLEVGCGTGLLTSSLVARGLAVDAVDPGANMIRLARRRVEDGAAVRFHRGRFEEVALPDAPFAAVFSATAFHWIEPEVGWVRAASLLAPGSVLALLQHSDVWDASTVDDWRALHAALNKVAPEIGSGWPELRDAHTILTGAAARSDNISAVWSWIGRHELTVPEAARLFDDVQVTAVPLTTEQTGDQLNAYLRTTSLYRRLEPHQRQALEAENRAVVELAGGVVRSSELGVLVTGRRPGEGEPVWVGADPTNRGIAEPSLVHGAHDCRGLPGMRRGRHARPALKRRCVGQVEKRPGGWGSGAATVAIGADRDLER
jgi:SAM-dependent methyltransferase